jgi:type IV secretion system protein VirB4
VIEAITILIAALGAMLVSMLFVRIRQVDQQLKLKRHRAKDAGLADLLNYAAVVDDGVIVCKNGAFMASWLYSGGDNATAPRSTRNGVVAYQPGACQPGKRVDDPRGRHTTGCAELQ